MTFCLVFVGRNASLFHRTGVMRHAHHGVHHGHQIQPHEQ